MADDDDKTEACPSCYLDCCCDCVVPSSLEFSIEEVPMIEVPLECIGGPHDGFKLTVNVPECFDGDMQLSIDDYRYVTTDNKRLHYQGKS